MSFYPMFIHWNPGETAFSIGSFEVRWYSLCWLLGLGLAYFLMRWLYKRQKLGDEKFEPLFLYVFLSVLIGARLGHCLFYEPGYFLGSIDHFIEMLIPMRHMSDGSWKFVGYQGLASHGGVLGLLAGLWLYVKHLKVPGWVVLDNMGICAPLTSMFIRFGNLMNSEIIGRPTDVPWAFVFERVDQVPRHPGQLYEALAYMLIFIIILAIYLRKPQKVGTGLFFGLCLLLIFAFRFVVEYSKEVQEAFEASLPIDMGQILSIPFIIIGAWSVWRALR